MVLRAGAGKAEIRYPDSFFPREGFCGVRDAIHARAVLLEGQSRFVLVSLELPSVRPYSLIDELKQTVERETGAKPENIWIVVTHDLSAPHVPDRALAPEAYQIHLEAVRCAIAQACCQAVQRLVPARFGTAFGAADVNANRDVSTSEGWWLGVSTQGVSDKKLTVVRFETLEGDPIAFFLQYAMKNAAMEDAGVEDNTRQVTAEVSGAACRVVEQRFGVPALYLMGAAGDQVPRQKAKQTVVDRWGRPVDMCSMQEGFAAIDELGAELGAAAAALAARAPARYGAEDAALVRRTLLLPGQQPYSGGKPYGPMLRYDYCPGEDRALELDVLRLGELWLVGMKPEATAQIGIQLRSRWGNGVALMVSMVNGGMDYLADKSAYDRLTFAGTHSCFARGAAELFVEEMSRWGKELASGHADQTQPL